VDHPHVAGLFETVWALALKESHGFSRLGPSTLFVLTLMISMVLLAVALRELPVGTGYAVWTGTGAVGAAVGGMILFGDPAVASDLSHRPDRARHRVAGRRRMT
jgi:quaternary ammonium compound-resistance protein SugE